MKHMRLAAVSLLPAPTPLLDLALHIVTAPKQRLSHGTSVLSAFDGAFA
jgi:hypothetical protein